MTFYSSSNIHLSCRTTTLQPREFRRKRFRTKHSTMANFPEMVAALIEFEREFGTLKVPDYHMDEYGRPTLLGDWLEEQRQLYADNQLAADHICVLMAIGVDLDPDWNIFYRSMLLDRAKNGPQSLTPWAKQQITEYRTQLDVEETTHHCVYTRIRRLAAAGVDFDPDWTTICRTLTAYKERYGHLQVPVGFRKHGLDIHQWCYEQRWLYHRLGPDGERLLAKEHIEKLTELGFDFALERTSSALASMPDKRSQSSAKVWDDLYTGLILFKHTHGHLNLLADEEFHGHNLFRWLAVQRNLPHRVATGLIREDLGQVRKDMLTAIGIELAPVGNTRKRKAEEQSVPVLHADPEHVDQVQAEWQAMLEAFIRFRVDHGASARVPPDYVVRGDKSLWQWLVDQQRLSNTSSKLAPVRFPFEQLEEVGFQLSPKYDALLAGLKEFRDERGHVNVPNRYLDGRGRNLSRFCFMVRWLYHQYSDETSTKRRLAPERMHDLVTLGFDFDAFESPTPNGLTARLKVGKVVVTDDLPMDETRWPNRNARKINKHDLSWEKKFTVMCEYLLEFGHFEVTRGFRYMYNGEHQLGDWVFYQRALPLEVARDEARMAKQAFHERIENLVAVDFHFFDETSGKIKMSQSERQRSTWEGMFEGLKLFKAQHGHTRVPRKYQYNGKSLGVWVKDQRSKFQNLSTGAGPQLRLERLEKLKSIDFDFTIRGPLKKDTWSQGAFEDEGQGDEMVKDPPLDDNTARL